MTKIETVRALNDSQPQIAIVQSVRTLQQAVSLMQDSLKDLPEAISSETVQALEPLYSLRRDVTQVLEAYDQVTAIQRRTMDELTQHMAQSAATAFESRAAKLDRAVAGLSARISELSETVSNVNLAARQMENLPVKLDHSRRDLSAAAENLASISNEIRPKVWKQILALILAGAVGGLVMATGQVVLNRLVPPSVTQERAAWADALWSKATPQERAWMKRIVAQPAS